MPCDASEHASQLSRSYTKRNRIHENAGRASFAAQQINTAAQVNDMFDKSSHLGSVSQRNDEAACLVSSMLGGGLNFIITHSSVRIARLPLLEGFDISHNKLDMMSWDQYLRDTMMKPLCVFTRFLYHLEMTYPLQARACFY